MRLSESLRRGILQSAVGGIINKFKLKRRRDTLFFEDILANYIKACEAAGYGEEMKRIGETWGLLDAELLIPEPIKKLPLPLFSQIIKMVWISIGVMEDIKIGKSDSTLTITTKKDTISRIIGENKFAVGCFEGVFSVYLNRELRAVNVLQTIDTCTYQYEITAGKNIRIKSKPKDIYDTLNILEPDEGFSLKEGIKKNIFQLKGNRIFFRGKSICNSENTLFHIIGNQGILLDEVPMISHQYFDEHIDKSAPDDNKLLLLKTLLQTMGWGKVKIIKYKTTIKFEISHLPCGLQLEKENWAFLLKTILGYMWTINTHIKMTNVVIKSKRILVEYGPY